MLDNNALRQILLKFAPDLDPDAEGIFSVSWTSTETFYRHVEEFVPPDKLTRFKSLLEMSFPGKKNAL